MWRVVRREAETAAVRQQQVEKAETNQQEERQRRFHREVKLRMESNMAFSVQNAESGQKARTQQTCGPPVHIDGIDVTA
jgi:hypothetical protein